MEYVIHQAYRPVLNPTTRRVDMCGGRGAGRSYMLSLRAFLDLIGDEYSMGVYLRQFNSSHRYSTFTAIEQRIDENEVPKIHFKINRSTLEITYLPNGNRLIFLGAHGAVSNNARLKSLESVNKLYVEEATEISRDDLMKIRLSLRTKRGTINEFYAYNPPDTNHHIMQYDYTLTSSEEQYFDQYGTEIQVYDYTPKIPNLTLVRTNYRNNLANIAQSTVDEMEALKHFDLTTYLSTIEGYVGGLQGGVVYRHFMPVKESDFRAMEDTSFYVLDFGFSNDPCCLMECKARNGALYFKLLVYHTMDDLTLAKRMLDCGVTYRDTVVADYGNGGDVRISTLRSAGAGAWKDIDGYEALSKGFSVVYAKKGAASILNGIQVVKSMKIYMTENSREAWEEVRGYTWAVDRDGQSTGKPVSKNDHAMDCVRYAAMYVAKHGVQI